MKNNSSSKVAVSIALPNDRASIYHLRHEVYAKELGQHALNSSGAISDPLDDGNIYIKASFHGELAGFISITPPSLGRYSIEKYVRREELPVELDDKTYEIRILTVSERHRHSRLGWFLMYAAFRWAEEHGAEQLIMMGRTDVLSIYKSFGAAKLERQVQSGAQTFELLRTSVTHLREHSERNHRKFKRLETNVDWQMPFPFFKESCCFHGGAFFEAIGADFRSLERSNEIINADVLDAWFSPSPGVIDTIQQYLPWLARTSPPTQCEGFRAAVAKYRGVEVENILPGAGSSDLIYRAFPKWLNADSKVLILDPMYGEYAHVLENVIRCKVERLSLTRSSGYEVDLDELALRLQQPYDMVILVNPNNPTGRHIPRKLIEEVLRHAQKRTRIWIDEAYLDYIDASESMEQFAAASSNVIVCKSMSKVYALSGMRAAYLCAGVNQLSDLIPLTPPWAVGLLGQVAAVRALEDSSYYKRQYQHTHRLRKQMLCGLRHIGIEEIVPGETNFLMFHLDTGAPSAVDVIRRSRNAGLFIRNLSNMGHDVGTRALRVAIKDEETNKRIIEILAECLGSNVLWHSTSLASESMNQLASSQIQNMDRMGTSSATA